VLTLLKREKDCTNDPALRDRLLAALQVVSEQTGEITRGQLEGILKEEVGT